MTRRAGVVAAACALAAAAIAAATLGQAASAASARANIVLTLAGSPHTVDAGQTVTYTATVRNNGPDAASNVRLRNWLPGKATPVSATPQQGTCTSGRPVTCQVGSLADDASTTVTITVTAKQGGWMVDQARAWSELGDPHPFDNVRQARTFVRSTRADLGVGIAVSPRPAHVGRQVTFTLTVRNHGPAEANGVVVKDWLPGKTTLVSSSASQGSCTGARPVVCSLGTLASGQSATVTVVANVTRSGEMQDEARVHGDEPDPASFNNVRFAYVRALA